MVRMVAMLAILSSISMSACCGAPVKNDGPTVRDRAEESFQKLDQEESKQKLDEPQTLPEDTK